MTNRHGLYHDQATMAIRVWYRRAECGTLSLVQEDLRINAGGPVCLSGYPGVTSGNQTDNSGMQHKDRWDRTWQFRSTRQRVRVDRRQKPESGESPARACPSRAD